MLSKRPFYKITFFSYKISREIPVFKLIENFIEGHFSDISSSIVGVDLDQKDGMSATRRNKMCIPKSISKSEAPNRSLR